MTLFGLACNGANTDSRKLLHKSFGSLTFTASLPQDAGFNELLLEEGFHTKPMFDANTLYKVLPVKQEAPAVEKKQTTKRRRARSLSRRRRPALEKRRRRSPARSRLQEESAAQEEGEKGSGGPRAAH